MSSAVRNTLIILLVIVISLIVGAALTFLFLSSQNAATDEALAALESGDIVSVEQIEGEDWWSFRPAAGDAPVGLVIYPGGLVDPLAYAPLANAIAAEGYQVILDPMPLNLAVLQPDSASDIISAFPSVQTWAIGGHSLGGAMAAEFAAGQPDVVDGLALWAAYPAGGTDLSGLPLEVVSVYGDADCVATVEEVRAAAPFLPPDAVFERIEGGNHTQFGFYGEGLQRGDCPATLSREAQQQQTVAATVLMLEAIQTTP
jgi:hypothetical protein